MQAEHEWPKPLWKELPDGTVIHRHANSATEMKALTQPLSTDAPDEERGWSRQYIPSDFPMALHASGGATILVRNEDQLKEGLANGWTRTPDVEAVDREEVPTFTHQTPALGTIDDAEKTAQDAEKAAIKAAKDAEKAAKKAAKG